jgi:hypothetical protein
LETQPTYSNIRIKEEPLAIAVLDDAGELEDQGDILHRDVMLAGHVLMQHDEDAVACGFDALDLEDSMET